MDEMFFDPNGPFGFNADFLQGLGSEHRVFGYLIFSDPAVASD